MPGFGFAPNSLRFFVWLFITPSNLEQKHAKSRRETGLPNRLRFAVLRDLLFNTV